MLRARQPFVSFVGPTISVPSATIALTARAPTFANTGPGRQLSGLTFVFSPLLGTGAPNIAVPAATITVSAAAPSISAGKSVAVPAATIALSAAAPAVASGKSVVMPAATIAITALAPTIQAATGASVLVSAATIALSAAAPTISSGKSIAVPAAAIALAAFAPTVQTTPVVIIDDTHDGDYLKKKLKAERKALKRRRKQVLDLYEQIVEGKEPPAPEVVAIIEEAGIAEVKPAQRATMVEYDRMIAALERAVELHRRMMLERDDEEVLLLL